MRFLLHTFPTHCCHSLLLLPLAVPTPAPRQVCDLHTTALTEKEYLRFARVLVRLPRHTLAH